MSAKKPSSLSSTFMETCSAITSGTINVALVFLFTVFPLIYDNSYINILETKYHYYCIFAIGMLGTLLALGIIMACIDLMEFRGIHTQHFLADFFFRHRSKTASFTADVAVFVFWLSAAISTLLSAYPKEAFWGNKGRYSGLFLLNLYVMCYFAVSRLWRPKKWYVDLFLASGMILCLFGITDYFQMDILNLHKAIAPSQVTIFTSTLGNINTYTAYVGLLMGASSAMFALEKSPSKILWYYLCMVISFTAIIMGCSDNAYLSIAVLFGGLPFLLLASRDGIKRYLIIVATFFSVIQLIDISNQIFADRVIGLESLFLIIVNSGFLIYFVMFFWLLTLACFVFYKKSGEASDSSPAFMGKSLVFWWGVLIGAFVLILCFMFFDANIRGNGARYGSLQTYLVFNDSWGTSRGYIWKKSLELHSDFPLLQKLFGYGPDTFGLLTNSKIRQEMIEATGLFFDSAHNSILQYLLTIGLLGTGGYLVFLFSSMWHMFRNRQRNIYIPGVLFAVACYVLQSTVNIDLPIVTPVMWALTGMGMAGCRTSKKC